MNTDITSFGAVGDGASVNTAAIQRAIDACASSGGGTVTVPPGRFVTGTIYLKSHVALFLSHGAVLKAGTDLNDYNHTDDYPQNCDCPPEKWCGKHLIIALEQEDVAILGTGTVEGCGDAFFAGPLHHCTAYIWPAGYQLIADGAPLRPGQLICFVECKRVRVEGITILNATCWCLHLHGCDDVHVTGLSIRNDPIHTNTDGIDVDGCSFVTVSDCRIDTGDDALAIRDSVSRLKQSRKPCEYVTVSNCVLGSSSSAVRIGVGEGIIRHVHLHDLILSRGGEGFTFMTGYQGHGRVEITDVCIDHIQADDVGTPLSMAAMDADIRRVVFENCRMGCKCAVKLNGRISDVTLRNVDLYDRPHDHPLTPEEREERDAGIVNIRGAKAMSLENVRLHLLSSFFDDRKEILHAENTTFIQNDIRVL